MLSRAEALSAVWICEAFKDVRADFTSAAIAAAWGAAADVPQNGLANPGVLEGVQSGAAKSGFCSNVPPPVPNRRSPAWSCLSPAEKKKRPRAAAIGGSPRVPAPACERTSSGCGDIHGCHADR